MLPKVFSSMKNQQHKKRKISEHLRIRFDTVLLSRMMQMRSNQSKLGQEGHFILAP